MTQDDLALKALALAGVFFLVRCAVIFVMRLAGKELKTGQRFYLSVALAVAVLAAGAIRFRMAGTESAQPHTMARESFLWAPERVIFEENFDLTFDFEAARLETSTVAGDVPSDLSGLGYKKINWPRVSDALPNYLPESDEVRSGVVEKESIPAESDSVLLLGSPERTSDSSIWSKNLGLLNVDIGHWFDFKFTRREVPSDSAMLQVALGESELEVYQYSVRIDLPAWTESLGSVMRKPASNSPRRPETDDPTTPRRQINDLMRATPGLYDRIPEVRQFLNRQGRLPDGE